MVSFLRTRLITFTTTILFSTGGGLAYRSLQGLTSCPSTFQYFCSASWGFGDQKTQMTMAQTQKGLGHGGPPFDVLTTTAADLQELLINGEIKSTDLVEIYLKQIERHNKRGLKLNAMISTTPKAILLSIAKGLDDERSSGKIRGPLHGIPITVKDNICTDRAFGMDTTCGCFALVGADCKGNAPIVDALVKAGMIIIGKANLSEMSGWKGFGITTGWSAVGGQTQSPYIVGGVAKGEKLLGQTTPAGSSAGSAAGVAAGFAPLAVATETDGSITQPANRAALYGIKVTIGSVSTLGTSPWSPLTDSIGGMAKSAEDLIHLVDAIVDNGNYTENLTKDWAVQKIGFVDDTLWGFVDFICTADPVLIQQQRADYRRIKSMLSEQGAAVSENVPLTSMDELQYEGDDALEQLWSHDFAKAWKEYLKFFPTAAVKDIADIVEFNKKHAEQELPPEFPGQQLLEASLGDQMSGDKYAEAVNLIRTAAKTNGIDKTIRDFNLDVIVGPMDGRIPTIAAAAGAPVGTVPLGYSKTTGRPYGLAVVAAAGQEQKIFRFMSAWDATMPKRLAPPQLVDWKDQDPSEKI